MTEATAAKNKANTLSLICKDMEDIMRGSQNHLKRLKVQKTWKYMKEAGTRKTRAVAVGEERKKL